MQGASTIVGRLAVLAVGSAVVACAHDPGARAPVEDRVIVGGAQGTIADVGVLREDFVGTFEVPVHRDHLWPLLDDAYRAVGLPEPAWDSDNYAVQISNHSVTRRIGEHRMSVLIDCGSDMTGPLADTHRIRLGVRTWLEPAGGANTRVRSRVDATASSLEGRPGTINCASRGVLERSIARKLHELAG